jgi:hypothetical protein
MALCRLVLLNVIDENLQTTIDASVIQVEAESSNLERLSSTFMLSGTDSRIESLQELIVSMSFDLRFRRSRGDLNAQGHRLLRRVGLFVLNTLCD